jgi:hypothetical protein
VARLSYEEPAEGSKGATAAGRGATQRVVVTGDGDLDDAAAAAGGIPTLFVGLRSFPASQPTWRTPRGRGEHAAEAASGAAAPSTVEARQDLAAPPQVRRLPRGHADRRATLA